jgi:hypothetical protein
MATVVNRGRTELCLPQALTQPLGTMDLDEFYRTVIARQWDAPYYGRGKAAVVTTRSRVR